MKPITNSIMAFMLCSLSLLSLPACTPKEQAVVVDFITEADEPVSATVLTLTTAEVRQYRLNGKNDTDELNA